jgi:phage gp29-like protein
MADNGDLRLAGLLCEAMLGDDRISGCLQETRVRGLLGLPISFDSPDEADNVKSEESKEDWTSAFPEDRLAEWMTWGIILGVVIARLSPWEPVDRKGGKRVIPTMDVIHPSAYRQDTKTRQWYVRQEDGSEVLVTPGDGTWIVYTPYGNKRPWARGAWRSLSRWWLLKEYAKADWGRYSERHGMGLFLGVAPDQANAKDRAALAADLDNIARDSSFALPPGFDVKLVESTANTWATYRAQTDVSDSAIAIRLLGQNLSTEVTGGSYAAAQVHSRVAASIIRADDESSATTLRDQAWVWWAEFNFGNREVAPYPKRDTTPPEDKKTAAETKKAGAEAINAWLDTGAPVDVKAEAEAVGIKLRDGVEVRERQAKPAGLSRAQLASGDSPAKAHGLIEGQAKADQYAAEGRDAAVAALTPWIDKLTGILEEIEDKPGWPEELQARLAKEYDNAPDLSQMLERAMILAELAGRNSVLEDL